MGYLKKIAKIAVPATMLLLPFVNVLAVPIPSPCDQVGGCGTVWNLSYIQGLIQTVANFLIIVGVIIAVIFIIWGGITWMAAGGDETKAKEAKTRIKNGIYGAAIVLGVGVILQVIAKLVTASFFG